ncbi:MAG TPA: CHAT domain-containing tetratricopeptide repeat protein, partial [Blastocatellia bacterium]
MAPQNGLRRARLWVALCLSLTSPAWSGAAGAGQAGAGQEPLPALEDGKTIERRLPGGEAHAFQVALASGQRLRVIADQRGIDVRIMIYAADGRLLVEMDSQNFTQGLEIASAIAKRNETYRVEIRSPSRSAPAGRYSLRIEIAGAGEDCRWIEAQQAYIEGRRLRAQPAAEAQTEAIRRFEAALGRWREAGDGLMSVHALYYLADGHRRLGRLRQSLSYYEQARRLALEAGDQREAAVAEIFIGHLHSSLGEPRKSLEYYERALAQWRSLNDAYLEARTSFNLGAAYALLGEPLKALEYYDQALRYRRRLDDRRQIAAALNNIGGAYEALGEWQKALDHYNQSLALYRAGEDWRGEAGSLNNLGFIYEQLGESRKALEYYERALAQWRAMGDRNEESWTLMNLGSAYARMNLPRKALECYERALRFRREGRDRRGEGYALLLMGELLASSDPRKALEYYDQALPLLRAAEDRWREAVALRGLGMVHISLSDPPRARDYLNRALALFRDVGARSGEAQTLYGLARLERARGDFAASLSRIESAIELIERSRADVGSQRLRASYFASAQKFYELQIDALMRLHEARPAEGFDALAYAASERARARSLLELLVESRIDIREGVDAALLERERDLIGRLNAKAARQLRLDAGSPQSASLKQEISLLENEFEQAQAAIRKASPRYDALVQPQPLTLAEIQRRLDDDTLLLEYRLGDERSWLWAITNRTLKTYELPAREQIELAAARFHRHLTARGLAVEGETPRRRRRRIAEADARLPEAAKRLGAMILDPAAGRFAGRRLVVVPDGVLHYIPFAALPAPATGRPGDRATGREGKSSISHSPLPVPLIVAHEIVVLPSASVIATLRRELASRPIAPRLLAAFADPVFHLEDNRVVGEIRQAAIAKRETPDAAAALRSVEHRPEEAVGDLSRKLPRLPFTRREAEMILALVPAEASFKATGFKASRSAALDPELGLYRYLHFATHSLIDSERPGLSALALSMVDEKGAPQDGFLRVNDIYNLKLPAELVVLSACRTGLGREVKGEGMVGLTRGFMYAGAA